jgi:hypothetical protein
MNKIFEGVSVAGIIKRGHAYIFDDCVNRGYDAGPIEYLYVIREEEEILPALDMEYFIFMAEFCEITQFIGIRKIDEDCHEFELLGYNKGELEEEVKFTFYLHRLKTFEEHLSEVKDLFEE